MGGPRTKGFTACVVVDEQTKTQLGSTGYAVVWELFDSIAYHPEKTDLQGRKIWLSAQRIHNR
ncbi:MAG: hypothetical protein K2Y32_16150 [Candidatus Obscuribacterales bacterium]|nr:hypothetical protein [Candidatus Obscuribacterales bacterium]